MCKMSLHRSFCFLYHPHRLQWDYIMLSLLYCSRYPWLVHIHPLQFILLGMIRVCCGLKHFSHQLCYLKTMSSLDQIISFTFFQHYFIIGLGDRVQLQVELRSSKRQYIFLACLLFLTLAAKMCLALLQLDLLRQQL